MVRKGDKEVPRLVFVDDTPERSRKDSFKHVVSQARRFQSAEKRQTQRISAQKDAIYARSLVGWQHVTSSAADSSHSDDLPESSQERYHPQRTRNSYLTGSELEPVHVMTDSGLRVDPFNSFPSPSSKLVMFLVDYHIHVWSPHKSGNFDAMMGYNTQLDLCWPIALQDEMLFDATVAVSRAAFVLLQGISPAEDRTALYHQGLALTRLQQKIAQANPLSDVAMIFSIGRMLSMSYMSADHVAFRTHFKAFHKIAEQFVIAHADGDAAIAQVIENRLRSWQALHEYRESHNRFDVSVSSFTDQQQLQIIPAELISSDSRNLMPPAFSHLPRSSSLFMVASSLLKLLGLSGTAISTQEAESLARQFTNHHDLLSKVLVSSTLSRNQLQLSLGFMAFCVQLYQLLRPSSVPGAEIGQQQETAAPSLDISHWADVAQTFINLTSDGSEYHPQSFAWSALVLGTFLLQQPCYRLKRKGHIIHVSLIIVLESTEWEVLVKELQASTGDFWHTELASCWRDEWQRTIERQKQWRDLSLWKLGMPKKKHNTNSMVQSQAQKGASPIAKETNTDLVEYLVLRDARDSLPQF